VDLPDGRRIEYAYDAKGQRTEKRVNGGIVEAYRWLDPLRLSEFHDGREWWRLAYLEGRTPVGVTNGDDSYLLCCAQVGTPLALATVDGHTVQTMQYDSFGNLLQVRGDVVRLPIGFAGGQYDADTGLTRFVWRDYDADTGRFTALDPMGAKGGDDDWYGYCVDDPVNRVDAWGLESEGANSGDKPYYCRWSKCDDNGTLQGDYKPIEGDKAALPFLLDFSVPVGGKRYTILPSEIDPFREYYERNQKEED
jgi:RHS repeat-associated protein